MVCSASRASQPGIRTRPRTSNGGPFRPLSGVSTAGQPLRAAGNPISTVAQLWRTLSLIAARRRSTLQQRRSAPGAPDTGASRSAYSDPVAFGGGGIGRVIGASALQDTPTHDRRAIIIRVSWVLARRCHRRTYCSWSSPAREVPDGRSRRRGRPPLTRRRAAATARRAWVERREETGAWVASRLHRRPASGAPAHHGPQRRPSARRAAASRPLRVLRAPDLDREEQAAIYCGGGVPACRIRGRQAA
jgi:hypothetical protein